MSTSIGQKFSYEGPAGPCSVIIISGDQILETRRDGKTFVSSVGTFTHCYLPREERRQWASEAEWRASLPTGTVTRPPHKPTEEEVATRAAALFREHPCFTYRNIDARILHEELGIPMKVAQTAMDARFSLVGPAPPPPPAPLSADEAAFYERTVPHKATFLVRRPSAKEEAWYSRDRAAYDTADPAPRWGFPCGNVYLWLSVQHGDDFIPVCRDHPMRTLRFLIDGSLRTFTEAGISPTAPLWARVSDANPTMKRVA
jgi:hypothetical protein